MKLSELMESYATEKLKARLLIDLELSDGTDYKVGQESEILIHKGGDEYHFEADHSACTVKRHEIEFI